MPNKEQRQSERFPVNSSSTCDFVSPVLEDFGPVKIKSISSEGIGLLMSHHLQAGLLLAINLINKPKAFAKTVLVRVVHVTQEKTGAFLVGCEFKTPLSYDELTVLVM